MKIVAVVVVVVAVFVVVTTNCSCSYLNRICSDIKMCLEYPLYTAFSEVNRHPILYQISNFSVFSENLFYKNGILKPCLSPSSLCNVFDSRWH